MPNAELAKALTDVRRASRLMWSYQRRMLDLVGIVLSGFPDHEFYAWRPAIGDPPPNLTSSPLDRWAWDFLPMSEISLLFLPVGADRNAPQAGQEMVEILIQVDDAFDEVQSKSEPDVAEFGAVEECHSTITLCIWRCDRPIEKNWFHWVWKRGDHSDENDTIIDHPEGGIRIVARTVDLSELPDRASVELMTTQFRAMAADKLGG